MQTSGHSNWGLWPISDKRINVELVRWELYHIPISTGQMVSSSPQINRVLVVIFSISLGVKSSQTIPNSRNIASILPGYLENSHILSTSSSVTNEPSCTISIRVSLAIFLDHIRLIKNLPSGFFISFIANGGEPSFSRGAPLAASSTRLRTLSGFSIVNLTAILPPME